MHHTWQHQTGVACCNGAPPSPRHFHAALHGLMISKLLAIPIIHDALVVVAKPQDLKLLSKRTVAFDGACAEVLGFGASAKPPVLHSM